MSLPTPEESRREIDKDKGCPRKSNKIDPFYPPEYARQDREDSE